MKGWLISIFVLGTYFSFGQADYNNWVFGDNVRIDFNSCKPVVSSVNMDGFEGSSSISDPISGKLLFYTNSEKVYNRFGNIMVNGTIKSNKSTTQSIIIRQPGSQFIYYIFTPGLQAKASKDYYFRYHVVDMSLDNGNGVVIQKDVLLRNNLVTEKVIAVLHQNQKDIWIIGHDVGSPRFFAYLVTSNGISTTPVYSDVGRITTLNPLISYWNAVGDMRASPNGQLIASLNYFYNDFELFHFDQMTGKLTEPLLVHLNLARDTMHPSYLYGLAFSSNSKMLYITTGSSKGFVFQYNLSIYLRDSIEKSAYTVASSNQNSGYFGIQLAPDGKIYISQNKSNFLECVETPNSPGKDCRFTQ